MYYIEVNDFGIKRILAVKYGMKLMAMVLLISWIQWNIKLK